MSPGISGRMKAANSRGSGSSGSPTSGGCAIEGMSDPLLSCAPGGGSRGAPRLVGGAPEGSRQVHSDVRR
ncbi:hypothetical protein GCM10010295_39910 [Streptomyces intermedius]|nr:hypothetical protein MTP02_09700 [Streptomyces albus]